MKKSSPSLFICPLTELKKCHIVRVYPNAYTMKLSIAICTHNEFNYLNHLFDKLQKFVEAAKDHTPHEYEIIVLDDFSTDPQTRDLLDRQITDSPPLIQVNQHALNGDFATHKNVLNSLCRGDWILNLDADESVEDDFLFNLPLIIESNPEVEAYWLARINTVDGLTLRHLQRWKWSINKLEEFNTAEMLDTNSGYYELLKAHNLIISEQDGVVVYHLPINAWPDPQMRLYKNSPEIKWEGKVHERVTGFKHFGHMPYEPDFAIRHFKDIKRQESQNAFYEQLVRDNQNIVWERGNIPQHGF